MGLQSGTDVVSKGKKDGWKEQVYYFGSNSRMPNVNGMRPAITRTVPRIAYHNTGGNWPGFGRRDRFGARWTGRLTIQRGGTYRFMTGSDDGSKVFIDRRYVVNNDGLHAWRTRYANVRVSSGKRYVEVQFFENGGHAGCIFYYQGTDTGNRMIVVPPHPMEADVTAVVLGGKTGGWKEQVYYFGSNRRCQTSMACDQPSQGQCLV